MIVHLYVPICDIGSPGVWPVGPNKVRLPHPGKGSVLSAPLAYNGDHNDDDDDDDDDDDINYDCDKEDKRASPTSSTLAFTLLSGHVGFTWFRHNKKLFLEHYFPHSPRRRCWLLLLDGELVSLPSPCPMIRAQARKSSSSSSSSSSRPSAPPTCLR